MFVVVEWSKVGREIEQVVEFNSEAEAQELASWLSKRQWSFDGEFLGDPRWHVEVMPKAEWEAA